MSNSSSSSSNEVGMWEGGQGGQGGGKPVPSPGAAGASPRMRPGMQSVNAWFGPAGTVTPLHTDPHHNLLCQVVGRKYVRLYHPSLTPALYPFTEGITTNSSQVELDAPAEETAALFPLFPSAPFLDCLLLPGQMLYIPPGWWHYVKSLTTSFSVSFWWQ
ncbi:hypothetical protein QJQ45_021342 [Haematococcus lacustris]|nr:hypothetical protein QJQ45_021342 [Haematococcus lacustris]